MLQEQETHTEVRASYEAEYAIMDKLKRLMPVPITPATLAMSGSSHETNGATDDVW